MKPLFKFIIISISLNLPSFSFGHAQEPKNTSQEQMVNAAQNYVATYFGGSGSEFCEAMALDDEGNIFIAGYTTSVNFPTTTGSYNTTPKGKTDIFIMKFDKDLKTVLASTLIGGIEDEYASSILYDKGGYIYLAGQTKSKEFPTTSSAYCTEYSGDEGSAFILKMDKNLKTLISSTFFRGSGFIVQDKNGYIYIGGSTGSADFPTTQGAFREKYNGGPKDVFVSKFDPELKRLLASTLIGGSNSDRIGSLCIDPKKNEICIGGTTYSVDFPVGKNPYCREGSVYTTGFVSKLTLDLTEMTASTLLNGVWIYSMMIHKNGDIYIGGHAENRLPTSSYAYYRTFDKNWDQGYISRFSNDLSELESSTVLPGSQIAGGTRICSLSLAQSPEGDIISAGMVSPKDFPSTPNAYDETQNDEFDTYILKMNKDLSRILISTFVGCSSKAEQWSRMTADKDGRIYLTSCTISSDFPTTKGSAFEKYNGGENDGFVMRLDTSLSAEVFEEFHDASKKDDLKKVKTLLSQNNELLDKNDKYKRTALHSAARYGAVSVSRYLIEKGADLNAKDESGNTPLHLASMYSFDEIVELLAHLNVDINAVNDDNESPLFLAAFYGTPKTVELLLAKNADRGIRDKEGNTLLHIASLFGQVKKVREILKYKPEVNSRNRAGHTPLYLAVSSYSDDPQVVEVLLDHGANLSAANITGENILLKASPDILRILIKKGANVDFQDQDGNTPLHSILMTFLEDRPFFSFYLFAQKDRIKILLEEGADLNIKNKIGKSPMDLAIELGEKEVIDLLKAKK